MNFPKNFVFSYFCFLFEQNLVVLGCSICILRLQETNFSERVFEKIQKKASFSEFWSKNVWAGLLIFSASVVSGTDLAKKHENFKERGMFTVVDQKVSDWCYHIFILRAREDLFLGKNLVEVYSEVIGF